MKRASEAKNRTENDGEGSRTTHELQQQRVCMQAGGRAFSLSSFRRVEGLFPLETYLNSLGSQVVSGGK